MFKEGSKIKHIKSPNFISEMVDSFNVACTQTANGAKISLVVGRDILEITEETLVPASGGFQAQVLPESLVMSRYEVANLSIPLEAAKALVVALQGGIEQAESSIANHPN